MTTERKSGPSRPRQTAPRQTRQRLIHGVCREACAPLHLATCLSAPETTAVILVADPRRAAELAAELDLCLRWQDRSSPLDILHFPEDPPPDIDARRRTERQSDRLAILSRLLDSGAGRRMLIATPEALLGACPPRQSFAEQRLQVSVGEEHRFAALVERLTGEMNYDAEALCEEPGQLAVRGGLIDIYPFDARRPYRIDFFGDEVESIRSFDPGTQRSGQAVPSVSLAAAGLHALKAAEEGGLLSYLPAGEVHWILEEPSQLIREHPFRFESVRQKAGPLRSFHQVWSARARVDRLSGLSALDTDPELLRAAPRHAIRSEPTADYRFYGEAGAQSLSRLDSEQSTRSKFESQIADWAKEGRAIVFSVSAEEEAETIRKRLGDNPMTSRIRPGFVTGSLSGGVLLSAEAADLKAELDAFPLPLGSGGIALITASEYFGRSNRRLSRTDTRARPAQSQVDQLLDFTELADGDPLVHLQHGVCLFRGLTQLNIKGGAREVISVEFAEQMTIHVPLHESHLLTRYVGLTKGSPKLGKIGGTSWDKTRAAAERATLDYAAEMLALHARRSEGGGTAFPPDHPWQKDFEAAFPFEETPDQLSAIEATRKDMESSRAMDRLVCGDVGFGKTEVALRAALKAALAGKQAALLVPTTVLCQQHFNTLKERMEPYPIHIGMVSRFRSAKENRETIAQLSAGKIDIVVGTHRLLSKDVHFHDLGLLVVDEEQRFGVRQKERIKQLRADVDILTLSATPIPRTLYLAMAGARSMSVIETPPVDRRPIETVVRSYDEQLVKSAIQAETDRGGQVFYLHNRIDTIQGVARKIEAMHPKLKVAVGHGQMTEGALEKIMTRFVAGEFDVLVCTTIIESGIDIPNCNTLIIEGADRFGLAQLYQIRGRVGRFKRQAYAYLLLHRHASLVDRAQKRLNALKQHNQLGAGFRIAMRDLELRGAGNLLGSKQSGHIAGVGFELYCQLLKQSVARLKGEAGADRIRAEVKLDFIVSGQGGDRDRSTSGTLSFAAIKEAEYGDRKAHLMEAALPDDYVAEARLRIDCYRRLALAETVEAVDAMAEEFEDRFGPKPAPTEALLATTRIRICAEQAGVRRVETEGDRLICTLAQTGKNGAFLKTGARFPRLRAKDPLKRLGEIIRFLNRASRSAS